MANSPIFQAIHHYSRGGSAWQRVARRGSVVVVRFVPELPKKNAFFLQKVCKKFAQYKIKLYICVVKERATLNARKLSRATRQPREWRKIEKVMKDFICGFWLFAVVVLAVVAYAYALIVGGLQAFGVASVAFAAVVGVAFWVDNLLDRYL